MKPGIRFQAILERGTRKGPATLCYPGNVDGPQCQRWVAFQRALNVRTLSDPLEPEYYEARSIPDPIDDEPIHEGLQEERCERIRAALECLNPRQRRLVRLRYGMEGDPQTLDQIGLKERITSERVRQILMVAERRLRSFVERKLSDLVSSGATGMPDSRAVTQEGFPTAGSDAEPTQELQSLIDALCSPGVPVLAQEELELAGLEIERDQEAADHVADAVSREVAFHE